MCSCPSVAMGQSVPVQIGMKALSHMEVLDYAHIGCGIVQIGSAFYHLILERWFNVQDQQDVLIICTGS